MFFNTNKARPVLIDGVTFNLKPLTVSQQIDFLELLDKVTEDVRKLPATVTWLLNEACTGIDGLTDEDGQPVDTASMNYADLVEGLTVGGLRQIIDAMVATGKVKKKP